MEKTFSRKLRNKYKNMDEFHNYRIYPPPQKKVVSELAPHPSS